MTGWLLKIHHSRQKLSQPVIAFFATEINIQLFCKEIPVVMSKCPLYFGPVVLAARVRQFAPKNADF